MPSLQQTLDQARAQRAWRDVENCLDDSLTVLRQEVLELDQQIKEAKQQRDEKREKQLIQSRNQAQEKLNKRQIEDEGRKWCKDYGSLARKLPSYILTNGLGQTLAFLRSKGKDDQSDKHNIICRHLSLWVTGQVYGAENGKLLEHIINNDSQIYRRTMTEALAYLNWLTRFAEAELSDETE